MNGWRTQVFQAIAEHLEARLWRDVVIADSPSPPSLRRAASGLRSCTEEHELHAALHSLQQRRSSLEDLTKSLGGRTFCRLLQTWQHEYFRLCRTRFENLTVCSFYWDPGCHSGKDWMVTVGAGLVENGEFVVGYAPMVQLKKLRPIHLQLKDEVLQYIAKEGPQRMAAMEQLVALDMGMEWSFSCRLQDFLPEQPCLLRPLQRGEVRVPAVGDRGFSVLSAEGELLGDELPPQHPKVCIHFADQGSIGTAGLHFMQNHLQSYMLLLADPNHRVWNDVKTSLKKCKAYLWRTMMGS